MTSTEIEELVQKTAARIHVDRYDDAQKALDYWAGVAKRATRLAGTLDDKIRFQRLHLELEKARKVLRLSMFEYEDAAKTAALPLVPRFPC
jgi:hypothetical protein